MKKTERLNLRLDKKELEYLRRIAKTLNFNLAQTVRHLIREYVYGKRK